MKKSKILYALSCFLILAGGLLFHFNNNVAFDSIVEKEYVVNQVYSFVGMILASVGIQYIIIQIIKEMNADVNKAYRNIGNLYIVFSIISVVFYPSELSNPAWQKYLIVFNISAYVVAVASGLYALYSFVRYLAWKNFNKTPKIV